MSKKKLTKKDIKLLLRALKNNLEFTSKSPMGVTITGTKWTLYYQLEHDEEEVKDK